MEEMGWIGQKRPRLVSVQSKGCAPIVRAYEAGSEDSDFWQGAETFAAGIRVPKAVGDFLILRAIQETAGCAVAVSEEDILASIFDLGQSEGLFVCPEGAACWAAFKKLRESKWIKPSDVTVVFNTGAGHKYTDAIQGMLHPNRT